MSVLELSYSSISLRLKRDNKFSATNTVNNPASDINIEKCPNL